MGTASHQPLPVSSPPAKASQLSIGKKQRCLSFMSDVHTALSASHISLLLPPTHFHRRPVSRDAPVNITSVHITIAKRNNARLGLRSTRARSGNPAHEKHSRPRARIVNFAAAPGDAILLWARVAARDVLSGPDGRKAGRDPSGAAGRAGTRLPRGAGPVPAGSDGRFTCWAVRAGRGGGRRESRRRRRWCRSNSAMEPPPLVLLVGLALLGAAGLTRSLTITSAESAFEKAQGERVTLPCTFVLSEEDVGTLDIEWVLIPADIQKKEETIILYSGDLIFNHYYPALAGRLQFTSSDPKSGDGSVDILNLKSADTGTYQCKVKKAPGVESQKIQLKVLVKPASTKCSIEGSQEIGKDIVLKCASQEGTPLLYYDWRRVVTGTQGLPATSVLNKNTGELILKNASKDYSGTYSCVASNRVGTDECSVQLNVTPPINTAGVIAGAIVGTLLGLALLGCLVFCCCKKHREKKYEKEVHHEIREDVLPPKSRSSTARSYIGSNRSSLGSMSPSNMEGYSKTPYSQVPSEDFERTSGQNQTIASSKSDIAHKIGDITVV
ncbi:coxsackievirus and adenovirus receptor isoform X1 [Excalfactoria chinensis]|uniref:coxsackievirus and adenovirus receptor isoform X1 n=1 Tax=Excalfactoria chinensis TaxID=46218 RepID=UPI003B3A2084